MGVVIRGRGWVWSLWIEGGCGHYVGWLDGGYGH